MLFEIMNILSMFWIEIFLDMSLTILHYYISYRYNLLLLYFNKKN